MTIFFAILLFSFLIFVHELGHFVAAKASKVRVNEFSMFMGPAIFKKQVGDTLYAIRCIPIGGYCAMEGENEDTDDPHSFQKAAWWKRLIILVAGSLLGFLLFDDLSEALILCLPVTVWGTLCIVANHPLLWSCWCGSVTWWIYGLIISYRWEKAFLFLILGVLMVIGSFAYTVYLQSKKRICIPLWGWALLVFVLLAAALLLTVNLLPPIEGSVTHPSEITVTPDGSVAIE